MRFKAIAQQGLAIAALSSSLFAFAEEQQPQPVAKNLVIEGNDIYVPEARQQAERTAELERFQKEFTFDWNNSATIANNKNMITEIEEFLKTIDDDSKLSKEDQAMLGNLFYKVGTFYTHVSRQPDPAIEKLNSAATLLTSKESIAWCYNQLAYAYEQKYATGRLSADKDKALYYSSKVIAELAPDMKNKEVAFAYCIKGLTLNDAQDFTQAEANLKMALAIYDSIPNGKDDQYMRTKNKLGDVLMEQNSRDKEAIAMLEDTKKYWQSKRNPHQNPYAARNLLSLGNAYLKVGNTQDAQAAIKQAIAIVENVYGARSAQLVEPYELLSAAYKKAGDQKLAAAYQQKAISLNTTSLNKG